MNKKAIGKRDYFWNMVGSVCYSGSSLYYLLLVTRICGVEEAGVYSLAFATSQLLLTIGRFGVRTYQATDVKQQYSFWEYVTSRIITCLVMVLGAIGYSLAMQFEMWKASICVWVTVFKMTDAVEDVFHGEMQRRFRVDLMGKMLAFRNIVSCVVFTGVLFATKDLLTTCIIAAIVSVNIGCAGNGLVLKGLVNRNEAFEPGKMIRLMKICFPIFISTFLSLYLYNVPKYAIDFYMSVENQTYYSILFMPSFVITLFSEIITKPLMTTITIEWERNLSKFCWIVMTIIGLIACGTVAIVIGGHFIGRYLLEFIYGVELDAFKTEFIVLLIGGGASASAYVLYNLLIAIRHEKCIIITYGLVAILMTGAIFMMVSRFGMLGASMGYFISCVALCVIFAIILVVLVKRKRDEQ